MKSIASIGIVLGNKYRIIKQIGQGGYSQVYLAVDYALGKRWAVKELSREDAWQQQETAVLKVLEHPMLPRIVDRLEEQGSVYIVMDYLEGITLKQLKEKEKRFSNCRICEWGIQLCDVLAYMHNHNPQVLYRDLKPDNIMLTKDGSLKLIDFGTACFCEADTASGYTCTGSQGFAAPEQYGGISTPLTDIYGLGATLEFLSTRHTNSRLGKIIKKCRKKQTLKRYQNISGVREDLEKLRDERYKNSRTRKILVVFIGVVAFLGLLQNIVRQVQQQFYYQALEEGKYKTAIEIFPEEEEPYLKLLEYSIRNGETSDGVGTIEKYRSLYKAETKDHQKLLKELGKLYFIGNILDEAFAVNYEKAVEYFEMVSEKEKSVSGYLTIARNLCRFEDEISWEQMGKDLQQMEEACRLITNMDEKAAQYEAVAAIYLSNRYYLSNGGEKPLEKGIEILEECYTLLNQRKDEINEYRIISDVQLRLAGACYLRGVEDDDKGQAFLSRSCELYEESLDLLTKGELHMQTVIKIGNIKRMQGLYAEAADWYERSIEIYPQQIEAYCAYALMKLIDENDLDKARLLHDEAKELPGSDKYWNYQVLQKRLEVLQ